MSKKIRILRGENFADMQPILDSRAVAKGVIPINALVGFIGASSSGKTFLTVDIACHVAAGMPWRGKKVERGLVIYCSLEGGASARNRFAAWRKKYLPKGNNGLPLRVMFDSINLRDRRDIEALLQFIRDAESEHGEKCVLVVVDTLNRAMAGGNENAPDDMGALITGADRIRLETGSTVALVHHLGKDESRGARGHNSLRAALDTEIEISVIGKTRIATVTKQRDWPEGQRFAFELIPVELGLDEDGEIVTSCIVEPTDAPTEKPRERQLSGVARVALTALKETLLQHGETMPETSSIPPGVRAVRIDQWRERFALRYGEEKSNSAEAVSRAFRRGKEDLHRRDAICLSQPFVWLTR